MFESLPIRKSNFHPLFFLRKRRFFSQHIVPMLDFTIKRRFDDINHPVYMRLMRNLSFVLGSQGIEPGIARLITVLMKALRPKSFWDVGANIGLYSWLFSTDPEIESVLFEPDPDNIALLKQTIACANLKHAHVEPVAVGSTCGRAAFARDTISGATGSLATTQTFNEIHFGIKPEHITVDVVTLDEVLQNGHFLAPNVIKIDVEGVEHLVLTGARELLRRCRPVIIFESWHSDRDRCIDLLKALGYDLFSAQYPDQPLNDALNLVAFPQTVDRLRVFRRWRNSLGLSEPI